MAISYVGGVASGRAGATGTTTQSLSGTLTGGSNTSPSEGDLVVVWCSTGADTTATTTLAVSGDNSGAYSNETLQSQLGTTYDAYSQLNWFRQGATVDTSLTIPSSGSVRNAQRWAVHVFRGVDSATPWDVASVNTSGTASGRPNPGSINPSTSGAWILWLGSSSAATGAAYTAPTDFSADWLGGTTADTADCMHGAGYYTGWTTGAYDPAAITAGGTTNAADAWVAKTAVLRPQGATTHAATGALTGQIGSVAGTAVHKVLHTSTGALAGAGSVVVGSAARYDSHPSTGVLVGAGSVIAGSAARVAGTVTHDATGVLSGVASVIVGSAARTLVHSATGVLVGQGSLVVGSAARFRAFTSIGVLTGQGSTVAGSAARIGEAVSHDASGSLVGSGAGITGIGSNGTASPAVELLGGGPGRLDKSSYWYRLLSPPLQDKLEALEPEIVEVIEEQVIAVAAKPDNRAEMQQVMQNMGIAYKEAYQEIYLELLAEMQQAQEDEQIAAIVAALL